MTWSTTQRHETEIRNGNEKINEFIYDAADLTASYKLIIPEKWKPTVMLPTLPHRMA